MTFPEDLQLCCHYSYIIYFVPLPGQMSLLSIYTAGEWTDIVTSQYWWLFFTKKILNVRKVTLNVTNMINSQTEKSLNASVIWTLAGPGRRQISWYKIFLKKLAIIRSKNFLLLWNPTESSATKLYPDPVKPSHCLYTSFISPLYRQVPKADPFQVL